MTVYKNTISIGNILNPAKDNDEFTQFGTEEEDSFMRLLWHNEANQKVKGTGRKADRKTIFGAFPGLAPQGLTPSISRLAAPSRETSRAPSPSQSQK